MNGAKTEFQGIVDNFKGTNDASIASKEIAKIDRTVEQKRIEAERKKALGYKILNKMHLIMKYLLCQYHPYKLYGKFPHISY